MARNKKPAPKKEEFIVLFSDCGSDSQLSAFEDCTVHPTANAALEEAEDDASARARDGDRPLGAYVIVKVVKRGKTSGLSWD